MKDIISIQFRDEQKFFGDEQKCNNEEDDFLSAPVLLVLYMFSRILFPQFHPTHFSPILFTRKYATVDLDEGFWEKIKIIVSAYLPFL